MEKHFASPIKNVVLAGIEVGGRFIVIGRFDEFPVFLIDLAEQVAQLSRVFELDQRIDDLASLVSLAK